LDSPANVFAVELATQLSTAISCSIMLCRTCHLAGKFIRRLKAQDKENAHNITDEDILCVEIAGLCHDLGKNFTIE